MRAIFIRHGESTGDAGVPYHDLATIELTERGHEQARAVAASWAEAPALIVTSPYTRTRQTAAPIARFPACRPVEVWPIEEFTYLQPARGNGSRSAGRMPHLINTLQQNFGDWTAVKGLVDICRVFTRWFTFDTAENTFTGFLEGSGGRIITILSLVGGIVGLASGRFSLGQIVIPVGVGVGAGTGIPIVTSTVTATI